MANALRFAARLAAAAHGSTVPARAAADILLELSTQVPVRAAALTSFNPITTEHTTLCSTGYPTSVLEYLQSKQFLEDDVGYRLLVDMPAQKARCWRDTGVPYADTLSARQVFGPAGYGGGATARLTTVDGRYTGDLHVSTESADLPDDSTMSVLNEIASVLAASTDTTRRISLLAAELDGSGKTAAVISRDAAVLPLPDHQVPPVARNSPLPALVEQWRARRPQTQQAQYHHIAGGEWWHLRLAPIAEGTLLCAALVAAPCDLTAREAQVLTLLSNGLLTATIARRLGISERTAAHHIEHILRKLRVSSRAEAARRAAEDGLRLLGLPG